MIISKTFNSNNFFFKNAFRYRVFKTKSRYSKPVLILYLTLIRFRELDVLKEFGTLYCGKILNLYTVIL